MVQPSITHPACYKISKRISVNLCLILVLVILVRIFLVFISVWITIAIYLTKIFLFFLTYKDQMTMNQLWFMGKRALIATPLGFFFFFILSLKIPSKTSNSYIFCCKSLTDCSHHRRTTLPHSQDGLANSKKVCPVFFYVNF